MRAGLLFAFLLVGCATHPMSYNDWGEKYLGRPYVASPLGEETGIDADPLIREDAFDCVTLVETVLANGDVDRLTQIRYEDGEIAFLTRNHFIETDWLRNNANLVRNVSNDYGRTVTRKIVIDKSAWLRKVHGVKSDFLPEVTLVEYLPYYVVQQGIDIDTPKVVLFVVDNSQMRDKIVTDLAVTHMGLLLPNGVLRHASSQRGAVVDMDFMEYVRGRTKNKNNIGIMLLDVKDE